MVLGRVKDGAGRRGILLVSVSGEDHDLDFCIGLNFGSAAEVFLLHADAAVLQ